MALASRFGAAWRAFRGEASSDAIVAAENGMNDANGSTFVNILGGNTGGVSMGEREALTLPAFLRALEVLCGIFAMTPMLYYKQLADGGKERATETAEYRIFHDRPNQTQNIFLFKELMIGDLVMKGRFGAFIHRDALYRPKGLSRVQPTGIAVSQHWNREDGAENFYDVGLPDGAHERLTRNDFWYVPGFSRDGVTGIDRLQLLDDTIRGAVATSRFAARFWENNAQPSTILTTKAKVDPASKEQIKSDWRNRFGGPSNAGGVAVLDQEMDAKFLAHDNKASQYLEVRTFYVVEIARALGVPPHIVFELSRATFTNIEQQSLELIMYHMMPHFGRVAAAATHQFAAPGHFFEFLPDAMLKGDIKSRYEAYAIAVDKGIMNPDEVRGRENMNSRPGGKKFRIGSGSAIEGQAPAGAAPNPPPGDPTEE